MEKTALIQFITEYIASRRQPKIDAFEKEAAKRVEQGEDASVIAQGNRNSKHATCHVTG